MSNFRRRLMMSIKKSKLPGDYTELEYIESTGTQYIDTGIPANISVDPKFEVKMKITSSKLNDYALNGSYVYGQVVQFGLVVTSSTKARVTMNCGFASPVVYTDINKNDFHTLYLSNGLQKVDNIVIGESSIINLEENNYNFYLFGRNGSEVYRNNYAMQIVYFKLWDNNNDLIRDLIPVLDKNNVACMYDKVNKKFYYNQGAGEFIAGPKKEYTELEYIESTGTQYIDTGYYPNPTKTKVETTFILTNNTAVQRIFGARDTQNTIGSGSCNIFFNVTKDQLRLDWTGILLYKNVNLNEEITLICINNEVTVIINENSFVYTGTSNKITTNLPYSMYIGTFNNAGTVGGNGAYAKWEFFKIYDENDNLVMDMIPVLDKNNVACMYDKVNNEFYYNQGTGNFIAGPLKIYFDYEYFYDNYVTVKQSNVGRCAIKLEPNTSYIVSTNLKTSSDASKVFVVSGSNPIWTPSTSLNGVLPDNPRTITTDSEGYICIGIYVASINEVSKLEFLNGTAWVKIKKVED